MQRVNMYDFYHLGTALKPLAALQWETVRRTVYLELFTAWGALDSLLKNPLLQLQFCRPAAQKLRDAIAQPLGEMQKRDIPQEEVQAIWDAALAYDAYQITGALPEFEHNLAAELRQFDTYQVQKKGIYSTGDLVDRTEQAFPSDILAKLPADAVEDVKQAGKCLAFEVATASGFHTIRATETVIHQYYIAVTGNAAIKRKDRNWGAYVRNLNKHNKTAAPIKADPKIISMIDQIREHHRNVVIHPESTLTVSEAQVLFGVCVAAIVTLLRAIP